MDPEADARHLASSSVTHDLIPSPASDWNKLEITDSSVHGKGIHARRDIAPGELVALVYKHEPRGLLPIVRTVLGRYTNHQEEANTTPVTIGTEVWLRANDHIAAGEEVFVNYPAAERAAMRACRKH